MFELEKSEINSNVMIFLACCMKIVYATIKDKHDHVVITIMIKQKVPGKELKRSLPT